jgi:deoxyribose-phosphate aldolase
MNGGHIMGNNVDVQQLPQFIDHTYLKQNATRADIIKLCEEAMKYSFYSVCVNSYWVPLCREALSGSAVRISAVCGFPLGANASEVKAYEAAAAVQAGAAEIDMVLPIGLLIEGSETAVYDDIKKVVKAAGEHAKVKVILETGLLTDDRKRTGCRLSEQAGAHFVKTSTGFASGGATVEDVRLLRAAVSLGLGVKASGGVRDLSAALQMIEAGATRLGTSSGVEIVNGISGSAGY